MAEDQLYQDLQFTPSSAKLTSPFRFFLKQAILSIYHIPAVCQPPIPHRTQPQIFSVQIKNYRAFPCTRSLPSSAISSVQAYSSAMLRDMNKWIFLYECFQSLNIFNTRNSFSSDFN
jgi:hypothetical protein